MSRRSLLRRVAAAVGLAVVTARGASAQPFTSLTFFGDSFTDTGNGDILSTAILGVDLTPSPPYFPGRASNGPTESASLKKTSPRHSPRGRSSTSSTA